MARRRHGFESPLHPLQITAWGVLVFQALSLLLVLPAFTSLTLTITCATLLLLTLSSGLATTLIDPCDASVLKEAALSANKSSSEKTGSPSHPYQQPNQQQQGSVYCYICTANVHKGTAHCRTCSKCVAGFDHHCAWLNTCIGSGNYLSFICTLASALAVTALQAGMTLLVLARWWGNIPHPRESPFDVLSAKAYLSLIAVISIATVALTLLLGQLLLFHLFLRCHHLTTYEYVVLRSQQQRNKEDKAARSRELVNMTSRHQPSHHEEDRIPPFLPQLPPATAAAAANAAVSTTTGSNHYNTNVVLSPPLRVASLSSLWDFSPFSKKRTEPPASLPGDVFLIADEEDEDEDDDDDGHVIILF